MTINEILKNIYYNPAHPASFGSARKLYLAAKIENNTLTLKDVADWLSGENTYTLHKDARKRWAREKILVSKPLEQYQADLVDMRKLSRFNSGFKYILTVIDCFSRFAYAMPVKDKKPESIIDALKIVFQKEFPFKFQTDRGLEFNNTKVKKFLSDRNIIYFTTFNSEFKCAIVERFNRTLKNKMFKYFTSKKTKRFVDVLPELIVSYNNSIHRTIGTTPASVNEDNSELIFKRIYKANNEREFLSGKIKKTGLDRGDKVRRKYLLNPLDKGYLPKWTDHIYTLTNKIDGNKRLLYKIQDYSGNEINERLYPEEIQKVKENLYRIEKIVKRATREGRRGFIVKWLDYPSSANSWVAEEDLVRFTKNG